MKLFVVRLSSALILSLISYWALAIPYARWQQQANPKEDDLSIRLNGPVQLIGPLMIWDGVRGEFVSSGTYEHQRYLAEPIINIYNAVSGEKRSINILKDFPNARSVSVHGFAVGTNGFALVACELDIAGRGRTYALERILLYDHHSALVRNFSAMPDDVGAVAMDEHGDIYVLGTRDDKNLSEKSYPLIVKYNIYGHITQGMLPRSVFPNVDDPVGDGASDLHRGGTRISVTEGGVKAYLAPVSELIIFSRTGEIQTRVNVAGRLGEFAQTKGYKVSYVDGDEFSPSGDLWLTGHFEEPLDKSSLSLPARNFVVRLTPEGQLQVPYEQVGDGPPGHYLPQLIGFTQANEPVAYFYSGRPDTILLRKNPYY